MCFLITILLLTVAGNFYLEGDMEQALVASGIALPFALIFLYRIIKYRRCLIGDCSKEKPSRDEKEPHA